MENSIKKVEQIDKEKLIKYLSLTGISGITETEKEMFLEICILNGLNPFKRDIYITAYGSGDKRQCSLLTGYEVYIRKAEESGLLDGWFVETTGSVQKNDLRAKVTIHRKSFSHPFVWEVAYSEYVQKTSSGEPNKFWREKPETMIKKVAISQGFRLCFNQVLGGMPYTKDEMPETEIVQHTEVVELQDSIFNEIVQFIENKDFEKAKEEATKYKSKMSASQKNIIAKGLKQLEKTE